MNNYSKKLQKEIGLLTEIIDSLGLGIDKKIKPLVAALRLHGFVTTSSCAGHLDRSSPYVDISSKESQNFSENEEVISLGNKIYNNPNNKNYLAKYEKLCIEPMQANLHEGKRLLKLLEEFYSKRKSNIETYLILESLGNGLGGFRLQPQGNLFVSVKNKNEIKSWLRDAREEFDAFTLFLDNTVK